MILFQNSTITLDYNPATDILEVAYPDLHGYLLPEIKHSLNILSDTVRNYDVKKVLLDSSRTVVSVNEEEGKQVAAHLASGLAKTRVQKVARVQSPSPEVEKRAEKNIRNVEQTLNLAFEVKNFTDKPEALAWLNA